MPDADVSVEDCLIAVSAVVGGNNIQSASRMNKAIVFFLSESLMVDELIESGLTINDSFVPVLPLSSPSKKVVFSNVPPFIKNETLEQLLQRYGKIISPIKMIPLGCKNAEIKHVMSFRRQAFMILNNQSDPLNLSAKLSFEGKDYTVFISSESMKCFVCGDFGHVRQTCPNRNNQADAVAAPAADAENSGRATGVGVAAAAVEVQPQPAGAIPVLDELPEGRPGVATSKVGPKEPAEEAAGPSHTPAVSQAEAGLIQAQSQAVSNADSICVENQIQMDKTATDDQFSQSQDGISSQEFTESKLQTEDSDKDYDDIEMGDYDVTDSEPASGGKSKLYSVKEINHFLDTTKGLRKPKIENYFPDLKLFVVSGTMAMKGASLDELDKPKRYRLKKLLSSVRSVLNMQVKK